ncbi:MAG TPA: DNA replication/repair protein RecF [Acidimicrobiia bacterium]|nr:DNA replication/repair protein RecF [Acidimicrobiia bacterium]
MHLATLELLEFRCYPSARLELPPGVIVVTGANGQGKTSLLEAVAWPALTRSFRGVPDDALIRAGAAQAVLRATVVDGESTRQVDVELRRVGRNRILLNGHPTARTRDLFGTLRVTVFAPDDLQLVKGGPGERRAYLDDVLIASVPRYAGVRADLERVLRHRNALLRGGVRDDEAGATLAVFDEQLVHAGGELIRGRLRLVARLAPAVDEAYRRLAPDSAGIRAAYDAEWSDAPLTEETVDERLRDGLERRRRQETDRGITLAGPHRDEWRLTIADQDSRTHASQGEQRTLALAMRLAAHHVLADVVGSQPVLLLDDVFSELDPQRSRALVECLPATQTLITTAGVLPDGVTPEVRLRVEQGRFTEGAAPLPVSGS